MKVLDLAKHPSCLFGRRIFHRFLDVPITQFDHRKSGSQHVRKKARLQRTLLLCVFDLSLRQMLMHGFGQFARNQSSAADAQQVLDHQINHRQAERKNQPANQPTCPHQIEEACISTCRRCRVITVGKRRADEHAQDKQRDKRSRQRSNHRADRRAASRPDKFIPSMKHHDSILNSRPKPARSGSSERVIVAEFRPVHNLAESLSAVTDRERRRYSG